MGDANDYDDDDEYVKEPKPKYINKKERVLAKYGEAADEFNLKDLGYEEDGMIMEGRKCTDPICCGIFIVFVFAMFLIAQFGIKNGNIKKLLAPMDGAARFCGVSAGYQDYPYLYFRNLDETEPVRIFLEGVCVKECPTIGDGATECMSIHDGDLGVARHRDYCVPDGGDGQSESYDTKHKFGYCIPPSDAVMDASAKNGFNIAMAALQNSKFGQWTADIWNTEYSLYLSVFFAFFYSLVFVYLVSVYGEQVAKVSIGLFQAFLVGGTFWSYYKKNSLGVAASAVATIAADKSSDDTWSWIFLGLFLFFGIASILFFCTVFWGRKSLTLAVDVIDASADFIGDNRRVVIVPLVYYIITIIMFLGWVLAILGTLALNPIVPGKIDIDPQDRDIDFTAKYVYMLVILLIGFIWMRAFLEYTSAFIVMSSCASYYWSSNAEEEGEAEVLYAIRIAHINHTGSIAFGSFLVGFVDVINFVFMYFARKAENWAPKNAAIKIVICCAECLIKIMDQFADHINQDAFAYMANTGENYCSSAYNGFLLNVKHSLSFQFATGIARNLIALIRWAIIIINILTFIFLSTYVTTGATEVHTLFNPCILVFLWTYVTSKIFLGIFETSVITMMTCLCVDMDLNDGAPSAGPPCFHDSLEDIKEESALIEKEDLKNMQKAEEQSEKLLKKMNSAKE